MVTTAEWLWPFVHFPRSVSSTNVSLVGDMGKQLFLWNSNWGKDDTFVVFVLFNQDSNNLGVHDFIFCNNMSHFTICQTVIPINHFSCVWYYSSHDCHDFTLLETKICLLSVSLCLVYPHCQQHYHGCFATTKTISMFLFHHCYKVVPYHRLSYYYYILVVVFWTNLSGFELPEPEGRLAVWSDLPTVFQHTHTNNSIKKPPRVVENSLL